MWKTLSDATIAVLTTANAHDKASVARDVFKAWSTEQIPFIFHTKPPDRPARPDRPELLLPADVPKPRKAGTLANKIALLHAVAHIELNAIDLAFDIVARFGNAMPRTFSDDWLKVGDDEARHFNLITQRLETLGSHYGALPAHDGLWQSASQTSHLLPARLAVVPLVLEARGLDVTPSMIVRFERMGDRLSADALRVIYEDEITHVKTGRKWFSWLAKKCGENEEIQFKKLVTEYYAGKLKRPFNVEARQKAGLFPTWYEDLAG
jgi:uncharacterized ferritin-like protein (DUF455 family)